MKNPIEEKKDKKLGFGYPNNNFRFRWLNLGQTGRIYSILESNEMYIMSFDNESKMEQNPLDFAGL